MMDSPNNDNVTSGFTIYWRIENFKAEPSFDFIKSQIFKIQCMNSNWLIEIEKQKDLNCLGAYLYRETDPSSSPVHYSLSLLTGSGWMSILENKKDIFTLEDNGNGDCIVNLKNLKIEEWFYLPNGSLTIQFRMWDDHIINQSSQRVMISRLIEGDALLHRPIQTFTTLKPSDLFSFPLSYEFQGNSLSTLECQNSKKAKTLNTQTDTTYSFKDLDDLRKLFKEKDFNFVTLRTASKEYSVHKAVLCAKSPVFNAMFERMKENDSNVVDIDDIDSQTMALFVKFLQFEPVVEELKWSTALSLYCVADKYQIRSLKEQCVPLLKKELSVENVCDILLLAKSHQDGDLMNCALDYFCQHSKAIFLSQQWKDILVHTELIG